MSQAHQLLAKCSTSMGGTAQAIFDPSPAKRSSRIWRKLFCATRKTKINLASFSNAKEKSELWFFCCCCFLSMPRHRAQRLLGMTVHRRPTVISEHDVERTLRGQGDDRQGDPLKLQNSKYFFIVQSNYPLPVSSWACLLMQENGLTTCMYGSLPFPLLYLVVVVVGFDKLCII